LSCQDRPRFALSVALCSLGVVATASQVLILRELLVAFQGNELLLGLFLGNWLLLQAVGTAFARRRADGTRRPAEAFAGLQLLHGLSPILGILLVRGFKAALGIPTGEVLGIPLAWLVSAVALLPSAAADGAAFPFGCRLLLLVRETAGPAGRAYTLSAAGSVAGGLLFLVPLVYAVSPLLLAGFLCLTSAAAALGLLVAWNASPGLRRLAIGILAGAALAVAASAPDRLEARSAQWQLHDHFLLATARSPYSTIAVVFAAEQYTFFVNGSPAVTIPHPGPDAEVLAHFPLLMHDRPSRVLVTGGGAGGLIREVLQHPVAEVAYAEQDPLLLETYRRFPTPLTTMELTHPAVTLHPVEGRLFLRQERTRWDVILLNLPAPATLMLNRYYTQEFFSLARSRLADGGLLAFFLPGSDTLLSPELAALNGSVLAALREVFRHVRVLPGDRTLFVAGDGEALDRVWRPEVLTRRLEEREIRTGLVTGAYIDYRMSRERFGALLGAMAFEEPANRDGLPRGTFASMRVFSRVVSPSAARMLAFLDGVPFFAYLAAVAFVVVGLLGLQLWRRRAQYVAYAAASTGFTGMLMTVVLLLAFQVQYGDVYQYLGVLTALFMLGAAAGAGAAARRGGKPLLAVESGLALIALLAYGCAVLDPPAHLWLASIFALMVLTGGAVGAQYPALVARVAPAHAGVGGAAATIYAFDLAGGVAGAAMAGVVLIPTIGMPMTLLLAAVLKTGSVVLVLSARRPAGPGA
jgi:spermidine synthase